MPHRVCHIRDQSWFFTQSHLEGTECPHGLRDSTKISCNIVMQQENTKMEQLQKSKQDDRTWLGLRTAVVPRRGKGASHLEASGRATLSEVMKSGAIANRLWKPWVQRIQFFLVHCFMIFIMKYTNWSISGWCLSTFIEGTFDEELAFLGTERTDCWSHSMLCYSGTWYYRSSPLTLSQWPSLGLAFDLGSLTGHCIPLEQRFSDLQILKAQILPKYLL
jgi:hypothetical protein